MSLPTLGKYLIGVGLLIAGMGILLLVAGKIPWLGRLPGDFLIKRDHVSFYFPLTTCLILSILLSMLFRFFSHK